MVPISKGQMIIKDLGKISSCGKSVILNKQMIDTIKRNKIVNDIFECPTELKGQLTIGEWVK